MNFKIETLLAIPNKRNREIAQSYDSYDAVKSITVDTAGCNDYGTENYFVESIVDVLGTEYECSFCVTENNDIYNAYCECEYCSSSSPCGHVGASIYLLNRLSIPDLPYTFKNTLDNKLAQIQYRRDTFEQQRQQRQQNYRIRRLLGQSDEFIKNTSENYKNKLLSTVQNTKYNLTPFITEIDDREFSVNYKIGNEKKYQIKNITVFLNHIKNKDNVKYGKFLELYHSKEYFTDDALKQIAFMEYCLQAKKDEVNSRYYYSYEAQLYKDIIVNEDTIECFYDTYKDLDCTNIEFIEESGQLNMTIVQYDRYFEITVDTTYNICGKTRLFKLDLNGKDPKIYSFSFDQDGLVMRLLNELENNKLYVATTNMNHFMKYLLSPIQDYFNIKSDIDYQLTSYEYIKLYGDVDEDGTIFFRLLYCDEDNNKILGFNPEIQTTYNQDVVEEYLRNHCTMIDEHQSIVFFDSNNESTYDFLNEGLDFLRNYGEIYISDALKNLGKKTKFNITVGVKINNDLLKLDIDSVEIPKMEVAKVLDSYKKKKRFHKLKNGQMLHLNSEELEELSKIVDQYHLQPKDIVNGSIELNKNRAIALENDIKDFSLIHFERKQTYNNLIEKFEEKNNQTYTLSKHYRDILRDYQKEGVLWLKKMHNLGFNGILADDMGLGKTLQVIAHLDELHLKKPALVVCPSSLIYNWYDEVNKFSKNLKACPVVGQVDNRMEIIKNAKNYRLLITSYDYLRRDVELYKDIEFEYVILDESQYIKNQKTKSAHAVKELKCKHRIALSGTPIENSLAELWSVFDFLMPQYLFNYNYFKSYYETDIVKNKSEEKINVLRKLVSPFILRRNKKDVLLELPDKIEMVQTIPFTQKESELYFASLSKANEELAALLNEQVVDKMQILALLTRLRQICLEPRMIYSNVAETSSKLKATIDLLSNYKNNNQKVLVFSAFTQMFEFLEEELKLQGISYYKLTGQTSKEARRDMVASFQKGEVDVFMISLKAGGTGLNLTAAEAVIHIDPWWNVSAQNQATDRAYRIGQHKNVQVHKLIMKDSIEEKIIKLQEKKKELADMFVENNTGSISTLSTNDIKNLFQM